MWLQAIELPQLVMHRMPAQIDVVEGHSANLDAMISGTRFNKTAAMWTVIAPTANDRTVIDWQRSDNGGASWRVIAQSFQDEANPLPVGAGVPWRPWGVRHSFVATAGDQGALIRARACYTPPATVEPSCVTSSNVRINVLQQSRQAAITDQPRSVLIRTGADRQLHGGGVRPARAHAAVAVPPRQRRGRLDQRDRRHRRHDC